MRESSSVVEHMAPPPSPPTSPITKNRKQIVKPWWILAFALLHTVGFVLIFERLSNANSGELSFSLVRTHQKLEPHQPSNDGEDLLMDQSMSIQRRVKSLEAHQVRDDLRLKALEAHVKKELNASLVTACQRPEQQTVCQDTKAVLVAYNPASYPRIWCGKAIPANGLVHLTNLACPEPPRVFPYDPTPEGTGMPAIHVEPYRPHIILPSFQYKKRNVTNVECDISCKRTVGGEVHTGTDYRIVGTDLKILHSLESAQYYWNLRVKEEAHLENQFYSTTSFRSEIPVPYFSIQQNIAQPAVSYDDAIQGASFIARNCKSRNDREGLVSELMRYVRVDSLSSCLHNADLPNGMTLDGDHDGKRELMRAYLFHLAFENSQEEDYVTEKVWGALESGTLPIYYGAPNIKDHVPPNSIISWHDFGSTKELAEYMNKVASNKSLYESHHEWRRRPLPDSLLRKFGFTKVHSVCRMCRFAYAKKYGLGWDQESQTVEDLVVSRRIRYDSGGQIVHPFREVFDLASVGGWKRTFWEHDGVIDVHFEPIALQRKSQVYRVDTAIRGDFYTFESNVFWLQNERSRITILTSWNAEVSNVDAGTMDILLEPSSSLLRLRVMVEDVDTFHSGASALPNYFGSFMVNDFFTPIEAFHVFGGNLSLASSALAQVGMVPAA